MTKYKIGGMTSIAGITFVGQQAKTTIKNNGMFIVQKFSKHQETLVERTPFLRGFVKIYRAFKMVTGSIIGKIALVLFGFGIISGIVALFMGEKVTSSTISTFDNVVSITFLIMFLAMLVYTFLIRHLHGLEHRFIGAYNSGLDLTVENVKKQRKETPQCGGTLLGIIIFIEIMIGVLNMPSLLTWLLVPSLGYECFLLAKHNTWYGKILYFPGLLIQKFSTGYKVSDETIARYLIGFKAFVKQEDKLFK